MFSTEERSALRRRLIEHAREDERITGCAIVGSAAREQEDDWSDIDLAFQLAEGFAVADVVARWSSWLRDVVGVADCLDVHASGALYRVFLLRSSLQVDLSFWPRHLFRAVGGPLLLVFGQAGEPEPPPTRHPEDLIRSGWLRAVHARSALARGRSWQAETMLADMRHETIALACLRLGLDPAHGRGAHELPDDVTAPLVASRASSLDPAEQRRSFRETSRIYLREVAWHDPVTASSLAEPIAALVASVDHGRAVPSDATTRDGVARLVRSIDAHDETEEAHLSETRRWVDSGANLYRTVASPVAPRQHLVSYFVVVDSARRRVLLGDHLTSGLWLPCGGHVEPEEDPADAVRRECREELGVGARFHPGLGPTPLFLTVTETVGHDPHRDVSLWYVLELDDRAALRPDPREYSEVRWWSLDELRGADPIGFDPHLERMLDKLEMHLWAR